MLPDAREEQAHPSDRGAAASVRGSDADRGRPPDVAPATPLVARMDEVELHLVSSSALLVGYHEASRSQALAFDPVGTIVANENPTKFDPPADDADGVEYLVLSSRGRPQPATSAIDVVLPEGEAVRSPVDGEVVDVRPYRLYGSHDDTRIEIVPTARPDLRVVLIHVAGARVGVGDVVWAGETVLADHGNRFPFSSHIDRYLEPERHPHVHIEIKDPGEGRT